MSFVELPIGRNAFSFGIIFIGRDNNSATTVFHEDGHSVHFSAIGHFSYFINVFVPSVLGCHFGDDFYQKNYYSYPYEYIADIFGRVDPSARNYNESMISFGEVYYTYTYLFGKVSSLLLPWC